MKKNIYTFLILLITQIIFTESKIDIYDIFTLTFPDDVVVEKNDEVIVNYNDLFVSIYYKISYKNHNKILRIYLRPKEKINLNDIVEYTKNNNIKYHGDSFGMGGLSYKIFILDEKINKEKLIINNAKITKVVKRWGSGNKRDYLTYSFDIDFHDIFNCCIIEILNAWPIEYDFPYSEFSLDYIDDLIKNNDKRVELYVLFDEVIKSIKFNNEDDNLKKE